MRKKFLYKFDYKLLYFLIVFSIISVLSINSSMLYISSSLGRVDIKQVLFYILGFFIVYLTFKIKNSFIYRYIFIFYILFNALLLLLLFFAPVINGSRCWFIIPYVGSIQPSEFMKIVLIILFSKEISIFFDNGKKKSVKDEFMFLLKLSVLLFIPSILTFLEPDTGSVIMYFLIFIVSLFFSPIRRRWFYIFFGILFIGLSILFGIYMFNQDLFINIFGTNLFYRLYRILDWHNKEGLQLENSLTAIASSGLFGHGFRGTPLYFPESSTDFIFSVFASNFGFIGVFILVLHIVLFDLYLLNLAFKTKNYFYKILIISTTSIFLYQQVENISMTIGLLPITGITLPFISYGGSSLISYFIIIGIIFNISREVQ